MGQKYVLINEMAVVQLVVLKNTLIACKQIEIWLMHVLVDP